MEYNPYLFLTPWETNQILFQRIKKEYFPQEGVVAWTAFFATPKGERYAMAKVDAYGKFAPKLNEDEAIEFLRKRMLEIYYETELAERRVKAQNTGY